MVKHKCVQTDKQTFDESGYNTLPFKELDGHKSVTIRCGTDRSNQSA